MATYQGCPYRLMSESNLERLAVRSQSATARIMAQRELELRRRLRAERRRAPRDR
jgi:hypothetical protein